MSEAAYQLRRYMQAKNITLEITDGPHYDVESYANDERPWEHHRYEFLFKNVFDDTEMTLTWRAGILNTTQPEDEPEVVFDGMISDAMTFENARDFGDFADEFCYDLDSRRAWSMWKTLEKHHALFTEFIGGRDELLELANFDRL